MITWKNYSEENCFLRDGVYVFNNGEYNGHPSLTVPDQAMPIKEILQRYVRGQEVKQFTPVYDDDIAPGYEGMDEIERLNLARDMKTQLQDAVTRSKRILPSEPKEFEILSEDQLPEFSPPKEDAK